MGLAAAAGPAFAQSFPNRPIRLIVPYPPGGPLDIAARALAEQLKGSLGTVVVENRPGAGGNIGVDALAKSAPDGYTLGIGAVATHAINPWLFSKMPYDPVRDFTPITQMVRVPNVLVMNAEAAARLKIASLRDLIAYGKANPGKLNYASGGNGSGGHMAGELLKSSTHTFAVHIPYPGAAPAQLSLLSGQTDFMFDNLASAAAQIKAGKLRAFAVTTRARAATMPDVPTVGEAGLKELDGFDVSTWFGVFAPAGTSRDIVDRLNAAINKSMTRADMKDKLASQGADALIGTPADLAALVQRELAKFAAIIKAAGVRIE